MYMRWVKLHLVDPTIFFKPLDLSRSNNFKKPSLLQIFLK